MHILLYSCNAEKELNLIMIAAVVIYPYDAKDIFITTQIGLFIY